LKRGAWKGLIWLDAMLRVNSKSDSYYYRTLRGVAVIKRSQSHASHWALFLEKGNGVTVCVQDGFTEPQDAASSAHRKDFSSEEAMRVWRSINVPDSIERWSPFRPDPRELLSHENN
jgi:hypothetical protein